MKGKFKKITAKPGATPRQIILPPDEDAPEEESSFQTWRYRSFMIVYDQSDESAMIVDLNGGTFLRHLGTLDEVMEIVGALINLRVQGQSLYPDEFAELDDEAFIDEGMASIEDIMSSAAPEAEPPDPMEIYNALRAEFINELIKPPKKDK